MNQENTVRMRTSTNQETEKMETTLAALAHRDYANHSVDSVDIVSVALQFEARGCGLFPRPSVGGVHGSHGHRIELSGAMPVGKPTEQRSTGFSGRSLKCSLPGRLFFALSMPKAKTVSGRNCAHQETLKT